MERPCAKSCAKSRKNRKIRKLAVAGWAAPGNGIPGSNCSRMYVVQPMYFNNLTTRDATESAQYIQK